MSEFFKKLKLHEPLPGDFNYHAIRKNCAIQGARLIWKQNIWLATCELFNVVSINKCQSKNDVYLWSCLFIDQSECLLHYLFLHSITSTSFLHLHCSQPIKIELFFHVYYYSCNWYVMPKIVTTCQWQTRKLMLLWSLGTFFTLIVMMMIIIIIKVWTCLVRIQHV